MPQERASGATSGTTLPCMDLAPTQYIDRDGAAMAYQVVGNGPNDIVN